MDIIGAGCAEESEILFGNDTLRVEFFPAEGGLATDKIAITFSAAMNRRLDGNHDGGSVLTRNGFDVIAFKSISDDWFQNVPSEVLVAVDSFCDLKGYSKRYAYGTSAGGFASIAFSGLLRCNMVLAIAPQYSIREAFDTRWGDLSGFVTWQYEINAETIAKDCRFVFVYDKYCLDRIHFEKIAQEINNPEAISEIYLPFSGHNTGMCLHETKMLKELPIEAFAKGNDLRGFKRRLNTARKRSTVYLNNLSNELIKRGHIHRAVAVMRRGHEVDPLFLANYQYEPKMIARFVHSLQQDETQMRHRAENQVELLRQENKLLADEIRLSAKISNLALLLLRCKIPFISKMMLKREIRRLTDRKFDADFYLAAYPDVAASKFEPIAHYLLYGRYEGRRIRLKE